MALVVNSVVGHAVIDRMNKQSLEVTAGKVMFSRNNCMESMPCVCGACDVVTDTKTCTALLLMHRTHMRLCLYGGILPP